MRTVLILVALSGVALAAEPVKATQNPTACVCCGRTLGRDVSESTLSADPDFKQLGMFQCCQPCMDKKMDRQTQLTYTKVAQKYKWNSISHNKSMAFKFGRRDRM